MTADPKLSGTEFRRRFRWLIFHTWNIPPIFGLGAILLIGVLTPAQVVGILTTPLEPAFILGWLAFAVWYLPRKMEPLADWLDNRPGSSFEQAEQAVRGFPLVFWTTFLVYLLLAPVSVVVSAQLYTDFVTTPLALFRIGLVALIVSIIVGLPIFFLVFDLFGRALGGLALKRPIFRIRTKVFLIGALVPLLIDTMLVQYYWTRTGYFSTEAFAVWVILELLAIGGSLVFARSFGQGLAPLQTLIEADRGKPDAMDGELAARSTDEIGVLTGEYRTLLADLQLHSEILELNNQLLRATGGSADAGAAFSAIVDLCRQALRSDQAFLIVHDRDAHDLVGVAQTGDGYRPEGHFRLRLDAPSLAIWTFNQRGTVAVPDVANDPRVSPEMRERFGVRSSLATPLWLDGEVVGVLMVTDRRERAYVRRDLALIEGLAREAALSLHTQRLHQARDQAQAENRAKADQVRLLMDATEEGIFGVDVDGVCTFINRAALRMLGYDGPQELLGRNIHALIHHTYPDGRPYPKEECRVRHSTVEGLPAHADDEVHWRADGTSFPVEFWSRPIVQDGRQAGAVVTFVDITERRQAEQALRHMNEELERRVLERTAELVGAKNEAERANLAKSEFLSRMSHELRTPLNAILGFGQLLEIQPEAPARSSHVREILNAGRHLLTLIDEVLDLARVESGNLTVSPEPVAVLPLVQECQTLLRLQAQARGIRLVDPSPLRAVHVRADRTRLKQVLLNLMSNAIKYNREGGSVSVACVACVNDSGDGTHPVMLRIRVHDTGAGLSPEQLSRLFVPFERLDAEDKRIPGTGIGLALSKRLVELMGGMIGVESAPGSGSTFWVELPLDVPNAEAARPAALVPAPAQALPATTQHEVLCIEDNPANLRLIESIFERRSDIRLLTAMDPSLGLELARTHRPALILLDINLPDMDGYAVMQCLRENDATRRIPVLAISANAMPRDLERAKAAGFAAYLTKPLDVPVLMARVDALLLNAERGPATS